MAVNYHEQMSRLREKDVQSLTDDELVFVAEVEAYIDGEIKEKLTTDKREIWIDTCYPSFTYRPNKGQYPPMTSTRKRVLREYLLDKYKSAGWTIDWHIDDGLDGPNMSGGDYLILKGT